MSRQLKIGDVIEITYPRKVPKGHEQEGRRPAVVIGIPEKVDVTRYPIVITIPLTTNLGNCSTENKLYIRLNQGEGNLLQESVILTDQIVSVDITRITGLFGILNESTIKSIRNILKQILEL
ncbi:MAG: type II toxin-antitoxin system PemK/MazF family toxin [Candidatus Sericytochromatia bacterium]|nr:type II toxin-antitoxin system PemK/MazF family toxin [Candidatus Sericytochromatia bacterium]